MQTVCAHCLTSLSRRQQGGGTILCPRCEQRWENNAPRLSASRLLAQTKVRRPVPAHRPR